MAAAGTRHSRRRATTSALLLAFWAAGCILSAHAELSPSQAAQWRQYLSDASAVSVGTTPTASPLQNVLKHQYSTPLRAVQASNAYTGSNARLRRVVSDLQAGKAIKIVAIGGVATNGSDASQPGRNDYFTQYVTYLTNAFPGASLKPVRASAGLAPSAVVAGCIDR